jgi:hypothetical protein
VDLGPTQPPIQWLLGALSLGVKRSVREAESIRNYMLTFVIARRVATQRVMAAKLTRLTHKIAIHLHLVAESCTICSCCSRRPVRKLLDVPSYFLFWAFLEYHFTHKHVES